MNPIYIYRAISVIGGIAAMVYIDGFLDKPIKDAINKAAAEKEAK